MQQGGLASIVETKEQKFGMLVKQTEGGKYIPNCGQSREEISRQTADGVAADIIDLVHEQGRYLHQLIIHMAGEGFGDVDGGFEK